MIYKRQIKKMKNTYSQFGKALCPIERKKIMQEIKKHEQSNDYQEDKKGHKKEKERMRQVVAELNAKYPPIAWGSITY